jgi:uncharacterized YigZ family protein
VRSRSLTSGWSTISPPRRWEATDQPFLTLGGRGEAETRVRGSRFLSVAAPADSDDAARAVLVSLQRSHFDATHHCSAWRLRDGVWRANDAGEPGGSAGTPILAAIDADGLVDVVVVVVRYFGGTKLGVGGLVRAYGEAAGAALEMAPRREGIPAYRVLVRYAYAHTASVMRALEAAAASRMEHGYSTADSIAQVIAVVPVAALGALSTRLREQTSGDVVPEIDSECLVFRAAPTAGTGSA